MIALNQHRALHILNSLPKVGPVSLARLMAHFNNDATAILKAGKERLGNINRVGPKIIEHITRWEHFFDLEREERLLAQYHAEFIPWDAPDYPTLLKPLADPPIGLTFLGQYRCEQPNIAVVGTRQPTRYGRQMARQLAVSLTKLGFCVVSGMARGIDTEAHQGALEAGGKTIAVLGCGPDIVYPPENLPLYRKLIENGAVVSEFPFGRRADRQTFPMRNRVIAGLCHATVVIESAKSGGAMITARFAAEQGRTVFAVPGRIDQPASVGCHHLIRDGATLLTSVEDIIDDLRYAHPGTCSATPTSRAPKQPFLPSQPLPKDLSETERRVADCFEAGSICAHDSVLEATGLAMQEVSSALMLLEIKGVLAKRIDGAYERR